MLKQEECFLMVRGNKETNRTLRTKIPKYQKHWQHREPHAQPEAQTGTDAERAQLIYPGEEQN